MLAPVWTTNNSRCIRKRCVHQQQNILRILGREKTLWWTSWSRPITGRGQRIYHPRSQKTYELGSETWVTFKQENWNRKRDKWIWKNIAWSNKKGSSYHSKGWWICMQTLNPNLSLYIRANILRRWSEGEHRAHCREISPTIISKVALWQLLTKYRTITFLKICSNGMQLTPSAHHYGGCK